MNVKPAAAVGEVQQTLTNIHGALCEDLQALQQSSSKRTRDDCMRRLTKCAKVFEKALDVQQKNLSKFSGTGGSAYVIRTTEAHRKRKQRDENGGKRLSAYEELMSWEERANDLEIAEAITKSQKLSEAITPCRKQPAKGAPAKHSVLKRSQAQSDEDYIQTLMDLDPEVPRTAEECVRMLAQVPDGKRHCVASSWSERNVIPFQWRGMIRRLEHLKKGNEKKAFKSWGHGAGKDRIAPVDDYTKWVLSHRPGESIGTDEVTQYLVQINAKVTASTVRNYLALAIKISESVTGSAKYKQEARDMAERSLRRVHAFILLVCAIAVRPGKSLYQPPASNKNQANFQVMKALGHSDVYPIHSGMFFNVDDCCFIVGDDGKTQVRAVPHNGDRAKFSIFKLGNQAAKTKLTIHFTWIGSSSEFMGPAVLRVSVKGREWSGPSGDNLVIVEVPGLCRGGDTDVTKRSKGYIVFVKNDGEQASESVDQAFFRWFHREIGLPFIQHTRAHVFQKSGWKSGDHL